MTEILAFLGAILSVWLWTNSQLLSAYSLPLAAIVAACFFTGRFVKKGRDTTLIDTIFLTQIMLLVISLTGGLASPLFFLVYFYLFASALLFEPPTAASLTFFLVLFFLKEARSGPEILQLLSVILFSPLSLYFGKQYLKLLEAREKIKILHRRTSQLAEGKKESDSQIAQEETSTLLWLSLDFKDSLLTIIHHTAELLADIGRLSLSQKEHLQAVHETAKKVLKSGERLKEKVDKTTD